MLFYDGQFGFSHSHNSTPTMFYLKVLVRQNYGFQYFIQTVLDFLIQLDFGCGFCLEIKVSSSTQKDAIFYISKVIISFVNMKNTFDMEVFYGFCYQNLCSGRNDFLIG